MHVRQSVEIAAAPERVWPLLVEPENVLKWYPTLQRFEYEDANRRGPGAPVYAEEKASGMLMKLHFVVTDWVENRTVSLHMVSGTGVKGYDQSWRIYLKGKVTSRESIGGSAFGRVRHDEGIYFSGIWSMNYAGEAD